MKGKQPRKGGQNASYNLPNPHTTPNRNQKSLFQNESKKKEKGGKCGGVNQQVGYSLVGKVKGV